MAIVRRLAALSVVLLRGITLAIARPVVRPPAGAVHGVALDGEHIFKGIAAPALPSRSDIRR